MDISRISNLSALQHDLLGTISSDFEMDRTEFSFEMTRLTWKLPSPCQGKARGVTPAWRSSSGVDGKGHITEGEDVLTKECMNVTQTS